MKDLKLFNTINDLNKETLLPKVVSYTKENKKVKIKYITVDELIDLGYLEKAIVDIGGEKRFVIQTTKKIPFPIKLIKDFKEYFVDNHNIKNNNGADVQAVFYLKDSSHLSKIQQKEIIYLFSTNQLKRHINGVKFCNYNLPDTDLVVNQGIANDYQYSHDMFYNSTFRKVTLRINGNISSSVKLFHNLTCEELYIPNAISPYNNSSDMFNGAKISKVFPNTINFNNASSWIFASSSGIKVSEIPSYYTVKNEQDRLTIKENQFLCSFGDKYQMIHLGDTIKKFGPVIDLQNVIKCTTSWGQGIVSIPKCTDVRIKGMYNLDYDLRGYIKQGGEYVVEGVGELTLPNIDVNSIKYMIENLKDQTEFTFLNKKVDVSNANSLLDSTNTIIPKNIIKNTNNDGYKNYIQFSNQNEYFKILVPSGLKAKIYFYNIVNDRKVLLNNLTKEINGDGVLHEYKYSSLNSNDVKLFLVELSKSDGSALSPKDMKKYSNFSIKVNLQAFWGDLTGEYETIPKLFHRLIFNDLHKNEFINKTTITQSMIDKAKSNGWTILYGNKNTPTQLTEVK